VAAGQIFVAMHDAATNRLTFPAFDPRSRQPAYKACAANVRPLHRWETR
jgi:assimilatory nitrate reductase catalytic subunit